MEWRPIESAPKDGSFILTGFFMEMMDFDANFKRKSPKRYEFYQEVSFFMTDKPKGKKGKWYNSSTGDELETPPTHWMPLPEPPKE